MSVDVAPRAPWQVSEDWDEFARAASGFLATDPERNTLPITVLEGILAGRFRDPSPTFGWHGTAPALDGAFLITPPHELIVVTDPPAAADLGDQLRRRGFVVPGVNAETLTAEAFAASYLADNGRSPRVRTRMLLYRLDALVEPPIPAAGSARRAGEADFERCLRFFDDMRTELGDTVFDLGDLVRRRIDGGLIWLWELGREPVSLGARAPDAMGVARIGPVYTPPGFRRRGFASAVTHICAKDALERGASSVVLFTDLDNPTSNAIYQTIGFRAIGGRVVLRFEDTSP